MLKKLILLGILCVLGKISMGLPEQNQTLLYSKKPTIDPIGINASTTVAILEQLTLEQLKTIKSRLHKFVNQTNLSPEEKERVEADIDSTAYNILESIPVIALSPAALACTYHKLQELASNLIIFPYGTHIPLQNLFTVAAGVGFLLWARSLFNTLYNVTIHQSSESLKRYRLNIHLNAIEKTLDDYIKKLELEKSPDIANSTQLLYN
ncbi:MAG TPA: hypothetical protein VHA52_13260 [Candidatus Babeliaceae bacterium]|nr:hypothetical protein [Candidatus Babeliaceae bacterium]